MSIFSQYFRATEIVRISALIKQIILFDKLIVKQFNKKKNQSSIWFEFEGGSFETYSSEAVVSNDPKAEKKVTLKPIDQQKEFN